MARTASRFFSIIRRLIRRTSMTLSTPGLSVSARNASPRTLHSFWNLLGKKKPEVVTRSMEEFSKPQYAVDVLKVEVPVNMAFVQGTRSCKGEFAYTREEAKDHFRKAATAAKKPFIYLSAGV